MKKIIQKIKNWFNGFRKLNYDVPLVTEPEVPCLPIKEIVDIEKMINNLPIYKVKFGLINYTIEKVQNGPIKREIINTMKPVTFTKVSCEYFRSEKQREIRVTDSIYSIGIDQELWRIDISTFLMCLNHTSDFDDQLIEMCEMYANGVIRVLGLDNIFVQKISIRNFKESDILHKKCFEGYIRTFGDENKFQNYALDEICPIPDTNEATTIQNAVHRDDLNSFIRDNSMIVEVVRKKQYVLGSIEDKDKSSLYPSRMISMNIPSNTLIGKG